MSDVFNPPTEDYRESERLLASNRMREEARIAGKKCRDCEHCTETDSLLTKHGLAECRSNQNYYEKRSNQALQIARETLYGRKSLLDGLNALDAAELQFKNLSGWVGLSHIIELNADPDCCYEDFEAVIKSDKE